MKVCSKCKVGTEFYNNNDPAARYWCKECIRKKARNYLDDHPEYRQREYKRNKEIRRKGIERNQNWLYNYLLEHPCSDCGEDDPMVLELDHIQGKKLGNVSEMCSVGRKLSLVIEEVLKCQVVCANCHKRRSNKRGNWFKYRMVTV